MCRTRSGHSWLNFIRSMTDTLAMRRSLLAAIAPLALVACGTAPHVATNLSPNHLYHPDMTLSTTNTVTDKFFTQLFSKVATGISTAPTTTGQKALQDILSRSLVGKNGSGPADHCL